MSDRPPNKDPMEHEDPTLVYANFDPLDWGSCDDVDAGMPFGQMFGRCAMAMGALALAGAFFYMLEENKVRQRERRGEAVEADDRGVAHRLTSLAVNVYKTIQRQKSHEDNSISSPAIQRKLHSVANAQSSFDTDVESDTSLNIHRTHIVSHTGDAAAAGHDMTMTVQAHTVSHTAEMVTNVVTYDDSDDGQLVEVVHAPPAHNDDHMLKLQQLQQLELDAEREQRDHEQHDLQQQQLQLMQQQQLQQQQLQQQQQQIQQQQLQEQQIEQEAERDREQRAREQQELIRQQQQQQQQQLQQQQLEMEAERERAKERHDLLNRQIDEQMQQQREVDKRQQQQQEAVERQQEMAEEEAKLIIAQQTKEQRDEQMRKLSIEQRNMVEEQRQLQAIQTDLIIQQQQQLQAQLDQAATAIRGTSDEEKHLLKELRMDSEAERLGERNQQAVETARLAEQVTLTAHRHDEREKCVTPTNDERTGRPPTGDAGEQLAIDEHDGTDDGAIHQRSTPAALNRLATQLSDAIMSNATGDVMASSMNTISDESLSSPHKQHGQVGHKSIDLQEYEARHEQHAQNAAEHALMQQLVGESAGPSVDAVLSTPAQTATIEVNVVQDEGIQLQSPPIATPPPSPTKSRPPDVMITQTPPTPPYRASKKGKKAAQADQAHISEHNEVHADVQQTSNVEQHIGEHEVISHNIVQSTPHDTQNVILESDVVLRVAPSKRFERHGVFERSIDELSATDAAGDLESLELDNIPDMHADDVGRHRPAARDIMNASDVTLSDVNIQHLDVVDAGSAPFLHAVSGAAPRMRPSSPQSSSRHSHRHKEKQMRHRLKKQTSDSVWEATGTTSTQEILHKYRTLDEWSAVMKDAGLMSCNLIFGIDYTASNKYQGEKSFNNRCLHSIQPDCYNPYQQVITIMGKSLEPFATTGQIPVYGFGDLYTSDWSVFSLKTDGHCSSLSQVLQVYNEVTPSVTLSGPTNFAPLIYQAIEICQKLNHYHILVIVADGQVTNERATRRAIVDACAYPLSIIVVGIGDGPWQMMRVFDDSLPKRPWDNFHFVEFHELIRQAGPVDADLAFSVNALLEVPDQYKIIKQLGLLD